MFFKFNSTCYVPGSFGEVYRGEWHGTVSFFSVKKFLAYLLSRQLLNVLWKKYEVQPFWYTDLRM